MSKNTTRRDFVALTGLCVPAVLLAGCGSSNAGTTTSGSADSSSDKQDLGLVEAGKLKCVSDMANPPFSSIASGSTEPEGFEIDLMAAVGEKLGLTTEWLPATKFDTIIPLIQQGGKADLGVANITITDERKESVNFSDPYIDANLGVVTKADSADQTEEAINVAGKRIAAQAGTTGEAYAQENYTNAEVVSLDEPIQALTGVSTGLYDAAIADLPVVSYLVSQSFSDLSVVVQIPTGDQYGIAVQKSNQALLDAVNQALQDLEDDGTRDQIETTWFGQPL